MQRAFSIAKNGRPGAVFIDVPSDIALQPSTMPTYKRSLERHLSRPDSKAVVEAAGRIRKAKHPHHHLRLRRGQFGSRRDSLYSGETNRCLRFYTTPGGRGTLP
ncbi:MAG: hypothetical protein CM1200mP20_02820 [Pseudomonadota bacterium]|nr:MAG: hypothetical protein CM1200mP20_02820 [Pseudomonadota bacterium]